MGRAAGPRPAVLFLRVFALLRGRERGGPSGSVWPTRLVRLGGGGRAGKTLPRGWEGRMVVLEPGSKSFLGVWFFLLCLDSVRRLVWPGGCASARVGRKGARFSFFKGKSQKRRGTCRSLGGWAGVRLGWAGLGGIRTIERGIGTGTGNRQREVARSTVGDVRLDATTPAARELAATHARLCRGVLDRAGSRGRRF